MKRTKFLAKLLAWFVMCYVGAMGFIFTVFARFYYDIALNKNDPITAFFNPALPVNDWHITIAVFSPFLLVFGMALAVNEIRNYDKDERKRKKRESMIP